MGYSARYHAASLAAVFLALAIGILIGAEFGGGVVSSTRKSLEKSISSDIQDARGRADELSGELARANEFGDRIYPVLVENRLAGQRIGILALGGLPQGLYSDIQDALEPTGAEIVAVGVIREPPDLGSLAGNLTGTGMADLQTNPDAVEALGHGIGRQIVTGGPLLERIRSQIFSRASGNFGNLDGLLIVREQPEDMGTSQRANAGRLESGMLDGITSTRTEAVGVEQTDADPSSISFFKSHSVPSADDVDLVAGRVATVLALLGAEGSFGVKSTADRLLPDLLTPVSVTPALPRGGQSGGGGGNGGGNAGHNVQSGGGQSGSGGKQKPAG